MNGTVFPSQGAVTLPPNARGPELSASRWTGRLCTPTRVRLNELNRKSSRGVHSTIHVAVRVHARPRKRVKRILFADNGASHV